MHATCTNSCSPRTIQTNDQSKKALYIKIHTVCKRSGVRACNACSCDACIAWLTYIVRSECEWKSSNGSNVHCMHWLWSSCNSFNTNRSIFNCGFECHEDASNGERERDIYPSRLFDSIRLLCAIWAHYISVYLCPDAHYCHHLCIIMFSFVLPLALRQCQQ